MRFFLGCYSIYGKCMSVSKWILWIRNKTSISADTATASTLSIIKKQAATLVGKGISNRDDSLKFIGKTRHEFLKINLYTTVCRFLRVNFTEKSMPNSIFFFMPWIEFGAQFKFIYRHSAIVCGSDDNTKKIECICYFRISL